MALEFNGKTIPGTTGQIVYGSREPQLRRGRFWDLFGEAEVIGRVGGRSVIVPHILHNGCSQHADLMKELATLDGLASKNGTLEHSTGSGSLLQQLTFKNCTFERYEMTPLPGQEIPGPLRDLTSTLFDDSGDADGGWFVFLTLYFRQLL